MAEFSSFQQEAECRKKYDRWEWTDVAVYNRMAERLKTLDKDGDDLISKEEFRTGIGSLFSRSGGSGSGGGGSYGRGKDTRPDRPQRPQMAG